MKIEIDCEEIEQILLDHISAKFGKEFNTIRWGSYNQPSKAEFLYMEENDTNVPKEKDSA